MVDEPQEPQSDIQEVILTLTREAGVLEELKEEIIIENDQLPIIQPV